MKLDRILRFKVAAVLLGGVWAACYNPSLEGEGQFYCRDKDRLCPEGFVCGQDFVCARPGQQQPAPSDAGPGPVEQPLQPDGPQVGDGPVADRAPPPQLRCDSDPPYVISSIDVGAKSFGLGFDNATGEMLAAFAYKASLRLAVKLPSEKWEIGDMPISAGAHAAVDVFKSSAFVAFRGPTGQLLAASGKTGAPTFTAGTVVDSTPGGEIAVASDPSDPFQVWIGYLADASGTIGREQLWTTARHRESIAPLVAAKQLPLPQHEGRKSCLRMHSSGQAHLAFLSDAEINISTLVGSEWSQPSPAGDESGVPAIAVGLDIFGTSSAWSLVHTQMSAGGEAPVLVLKAPNKTPEVVSIDGNALFEVGKPTLVTAQGAMALAFTDLRGTAYFTARTTNIPWIDPISFDDTQKAAVEQIELVGNEPEGLHAIYRREGELIHRAISCRIEAP